MTELTQLRTENGKMFDAGRDAKTGRPSYTLEARTGPIHYKEAYADREPWLDLDESYSEPGELKGIGRVLVYPRLPNIVTVFKDICGYQIQSRSNPDHIAKVELVGIDGQEVTAWQDSAALRTSVRVHPYRVGIWKDFSAASKPKSTTMRWKVTELGNADKDSHPFAFRESPEAYNTSDLDSLGPAAMEQAKIAIETSRTRIDDTSWHWDEIIPAAAKLVDTDWQVGAGADDGWWDAPSTFDSSADTLYVGYVGTNVTRHIYCRFTAITIAAGSTITACDISFKADASRTDTTPVRLQFVKATNPSAPTTAAACEGLSLTTAYTDDSYDEWTKDQWYTTTGLTGTLQEVIDQGGWSSGNAVLLTTKYTGSEGLNYQRAYAYDDSSSNAPKLSITWTEPTTLPVFYYHYNNMRP